MNATNPFQIPSWAEINRQQRRRERFKKTVIVAVAVAVLLLAGLLIEGCKIERAANAAPITPPGWVAAVPVDPPAAPVSKGNVMMDAGQATTIYVVKSGDTLSRIARAHGITVKAIEAANDLNSEQITVGVKLKIPEA